MLLPSFLGPLPIQYLELVVYMLMSCNFVLQSIRSLLTHFAYPLRAIPDWLISVSSRSQG